MSNRTPDRRPWTVNRGSWTKDQVRSTALLFLFAILLAPAHLPAAEPVDGIAAKVGKEVILQSEVEEAVRVILADAGAAQLPGGDTLAQLRKQVLSQMIDKKVLLFKARQDSIEVDKSDVDAELETLVKNFRSRFPSDEEFQKELARQHLTLDRVKDIYREKIREDLTVQRLIDREIRPKVTLTAKDVEEFYKTYKDSLPFEPERVHLAHILIAATPGEASTKRAVEKIRLIERRLKTAKAGFAKLAERYSEDPESAPRGGDLGWMRRGTSMPDFEQLAFALKAGETTPGMQSPFGFEIFRCVGKEGDSVHILRILVRVQPDPSDSTKAAKRVEVLRERIRAGEDFGELAKAWSDDDSTKAKGGDLGFLDVQDVSPELKQAIAALKLGEVSEPLRQDLTPSVYAFSLVKLVERIPAKRLTLDKDRDRIGDMAKNKKLQDRLDAYLNDLRQKVYIETKS